MDQTSPTQIAWISEHLVSLLLIYDERENPSEAET